MLKLFRKLNKQRYHKIMINWSNEIKYSLTKTT